MKALDLLRAIVVLLPFTAAAGSGVVEIDYQADTVVSIDAAQGYAVHIALDPQEQIESVAVGDAKHWAVVAKDGAHDLYLKPRDAAKPTNLLLRTDQRIYSFHLRLTQGSPTYLVTFRYHEPPPVTPQLPRLDHNYTMQVGPSSENIEPISAYDDSHFTYLAFAPHAEMPAVFEVLPDRTERLLNFHVQNGVLVIHAVVRHLALRLGSSVVSVFHDSEEVPVLTPDPVTVDRAARKDRNVTGTP